MDYSIITDIFKLIILLPIVLILIYISFKFGGKYLANINNGRIIKIYERVQLGQNCFLSVISISDKIYVIANSEKGAEILIELDNSVLSEYKNSNFDKSLLSKIINSNLHNNFVKRKDKYE